MKKASIRDYGLLIVAIFCACFAFSLLFPGSSWWIFPAALSLNGAMCVGHGVTIIRRMRILMGLFFCILGGVQLGIVTLAIIRAGQS
jgi:uncharacterized membrane protein YjjP (DUF1212 family)